MAPRFDRERWNLAALWLVISFALLTFGCGSPPDQGGADSIQDSDLRHWIQMLASDEFEGRGPSSPGEKRTVGYLRDEFQSIGLLPGNGSSFFQEVPLVDITVQGSPQLTLSKKGNSQVYEFGDDFVAWTTRVVETVSLDESELVFVGYGIVAPEYDWNDYEGLDVSGKTVVILVNDPGYASGDANLFNQSAMTYYGRWTYKYEEAARQGAAGALVIHDTGPAGYGWGTVRNSWTGPQFDLVRDDDNMSRVAVEGWLALETARQLFSMAGQDLDALRTAAHERDFQAVSLGVDASIILENSIRRSLSSNVAGLLKGSAHPEEYVVYMAHWDHFGRDPNLEGDQIYNGALDNATGTAGLLTLAKAFASLDQPPSRSVLFLAVTAEEQGLLGSAYYATHPIVPTRQTVASINMDGLNTLGPMNDITVIGHGNSELDDYLQEAARKAGRVVRPDPEPEKGYYYRSDHFNFAKAGVPSLYTDAGIDHVQHGEEWALERRKDYIVNNYHKPSDEYDPSWDLAGAVDDLKLLFDVGHRLATSRDFPNWREGTEFRATREDDRNEAR